MGEVSYRPLIEDMTWSYSRVGCFKDCRYRFYLKYIDKCKSVPMFYSSFGSFIHKLLEKYYKGELTQSQLVSEYLLNFQSEVKGDRPSEKAATDYFNQGLDYFKNFTPFDMETLGVEKRLKFEINGIPVVGIADYIGEKDGKLYLIDNKSRALKPRSHRKTPTQNDLTINEMLKQLYLYSYGIKEEYGRFPDKLCFNCFRTQTFIEEDFNPDTYKSVITGFEKEIERIKNVSDFSPYIDWFPCNFICDVSHECCYFDRGKR
jgi:hypothetical protein